MKNVPSVVTFQDPAFWTVTSWLQLGYGVWVNLSVIGIGLAFGFPAVTVPQLMEPKSPIKLTVSDQAWIASALTLFSPIGCIVSGYLLDTYGRRYVLIVCQIPVFVGWMYTGMSSTATNIIFGRIITGFGIGLSMGAPRTYITEITLPNMRGVIGAFPCFAVGLGITIQAALGSFLKWSTLCFICGAFSIILLLTYMLLPDTPYYVLMKLSADDAKRVLRKFRSKTFNVDAEIEDMADFKLVNNIHRLTFKEQVKEVIKTSSCKPFCIANVYITLMQTVGVNVITMWGIEMLQASNCSINPNFGNFVLATTRMIVGIGTSILLFRVGRRFLALLSAIGVGIVCLALAIWLYANGRKSVYPLLFFTAYMTFATLGYYTLPALYLFELLPLQVRGVLGGAGLAYANLLMFIVNLCYPYLRDTIGFTAIILIFGIISLLGSVLLYFILPETKGMTLQEIQEYFNSIRPTLVPSRQYMIAQTGPSTPTQQQDEDDNYEIKKKMFKNKLTKLKSVKINPSKHDKDDTLDDDRKKENVDKKKKNSDDKRKKELKDSDSDD